MRRGRLCVSGYFVYLPRMLRKLPSEQLQLSLITGLGETI